MYAGTESMKQHQASDASAAGQAAGHKTRHEEMTFKGGVNGGKVGDDARSSSHANAIRAAGARTTEGSLECNIVGCHKSVAPSRRKKNFRTCGRPTCAKNANN